MSWLDELDKDYDQIQRGRDMKRTILAKCVDIYAHAELDMEWTNDSHGNGTNSSEASNVADDLLEIIGMSKDDPEVERLIQKRLEVLYDY